MESLSDIVAEMRRNGDAWCEDKSMNKTECLGLITWNYAGRIEAAWKRECETWRQRVKDALAVADQFKGALDHVLNAAIFEQRKGGAE